MSDERDPETDQVAPTPNDGPSMHDLAAEFILERKQFGLGKYGSLLQANNGRDNIQDAIDEVADCLVYLFAEREQRHRDHTDREITIRFVNANAARVFASGLAAHGRVRTAGIDAHAEVVR